MRNSGRLSAKAKYTPKRLPEPSLSADFPGARGAGPTGVSETLHWPRTRRSMPAVDASNLQTSDRLGEQDLSPMNFAHQFTIPMDLGPGSRGVVCPTLPNRGANTLAFRSIPAGKPRSRTSPLTTRRHLGRSRIEKEQAKRKGEVARVKFPDGMGVVARPGSAKPISR